MKNPVFSEYITDKGFKILYTGNPDLGKLDQLAAGPGDLWHSSLDQGFRDYLPEVVYQMATFWWYVFDFEGLDEAISWRVNPKAFAVRKEVWDAMGGFDLNFEDENMRAVALGFQLLRFSGGTPLYVNGLYPKDGHRPDPPIAEDIFLFYRKFFKAVHSRYLLFRMGWWNPSLWKAFSKARQKTAYLSEHPRIPLRKLKPLKDQPRVSYIIPTMFRQDFTLQLLQDLSKQEYLPTEVVIADGTPPEKREENIYLGGDYPFELKVHWQETKGSCRARNEAIQLSKGEYIFFGDDDIRLPPDFIVNHLRMMVTYRVKATNGLDIRAGHHTDSLETLFKKRNEPLQHHFISGASSQFNNANSCAHREVVDLVGGNDINYDGGYGEDNDFGLSLVKKGVVVLRNPLSSNLHLKPPSGGYRYWGLQASLLGRKRKIQPWELDHPVRWIRPVPSPTIIYQFLKHFKPVQLREYRYRYFLKFLLSGSRWKLPLRLIALPWRWLQFRESVKYAERLMNRPGRK